MIYLGIDLINEGWPKKFEKARVGILVHSASVNRDLRYSWEVFWDFKRAKLCSIFGPQHGLFGETQANMVEWEGYKDPFTGLTVYSLYGKVRKPTPEMLRDIDGVVVDLQDVGSRYYTYIWTLYLVMEACLENNKFVVVLDRPNPISGDFIEGFVLKERFSSFVGLRPLPVRHGMTIGELALYFRDFYLKGLDLFVIKMDGWRRSLFWDDTGLEWVNPSPNMPSLKAALLYPGMCLLEGTNVSEGRGTTRPFEVFGAPFIEPCRLARELNSMGLEGVYFRPFFFIPTFDKYCGQRCGGVHIHIINKYKVKPFKVGVAILKALMDLYPGDFRWSEGPYEYEYEKKPIDILAGTDELRHDLESGKSMDELEFKWQGEEKGFNENIRKNYLIYD